MKTPLNSKKAPLLAVCLTCLLVIALLGGCDNPATAVHTEAVTQVKKSRPSVRVREYCHQGVVYFYGSYFQSSWISAAKWNSDGTIATCDD